VVVAEVVVGSNCCLIGCVSAVAVIDSSYFRPAIAVAVVLGSN